MTVPIMSTPVCLHTYMKDKTSSSHAELAVCFVQNVDILHTRKLLFFDILVTKMIATIGVNMTKSTVPAF